MSKPLRTISARGAIQRTKSMFGIKDTSYDADLIEWIGEAMQGIGYHAGFETVPCYITIANYRAYIPKHLESLNYIEYNGHRLVLGIDKSDYGFINKPDGGFRTPATYEELLELNKQIDRLAILQAQLEADPTNQSIINAIIDANFQIDTAARNLRLGAYGVNHSCEFYNIEGDYIKTSFASGQIQLNAEAFLLDDRGCPKIVDSYKYVKAVEWYLMSMLCLRGVKHPEVDWKTCWIMWDGDGMHEKGFRYQASNEQKMPDIDQLERFSQRWQSVTREASVKHALDFLQ